MGEMRSTDEFVRLLKKGLNEIKILENKNLELIQDELGYAIGREGGSCIEHWKRGHTPKSSEELEKLGREIVKRSRLKEDWLQRFLFHGGHPHYQHPQILYNNTPDPEFDEPAYSFTETNTLTKNRTISYMVYVITGVTAVALLTSFLLFNLNPEAFTSFFSTPTVTPTPVVIPTIASVPTLPPPVLQIADFEVGTNELWQIWEAEPGCNLRAVDNSENAFNGSKYLVINSKQSQCNSFRQDMQGKIEPGRTYTFSIWGRSANEMPKNVELVIWLLGTGQGYEPKAAEFFTLNPNWQCLETSIEIPSHIQTTNIRVEIFMHSQEEGEAYFDQASFGDTLTPCPLPDVTITPAGVGSFYPGAEIGTNISITNQRDLPLDIGEIEIWLANIENPQTPIGLVLEIPIPLINKRATYSVYRKFAVPIETPPGNYVIMGNGFFAGQKKEIEPVQVTITACEENVLFCDVPETSWAFDEITVWADKKLTAGCNSSAEWGKNMPFCPDTLLYRWMLAIFLLKALEGSDYKPSEISTFYFTDITEHPQNKWIEDFHKLGIELPSSPTCLFNELRPQFCPDVLMTRGEVAQSLAQLYKWPVYETSDMPFTDVPADHPAYNALAHMWQTGLLPTNDPHCPADDNGSRFCPDDPISRDSAVVLLVRFLPELELPAATPTP